MAKINLNIAIAILNVTDQSAALKPNKNSFVFKQNSAGKDKQVKRKKLRANIALALLQLNKTDSGTWTVITDKDRLSRQKISKEKIFSILLLVTLAHRTFIKYLTPQRNSHSSRIHVKHKSR